jgi:hypothetical protein
MEEKGVFQVPYTVLNTGETKALKDIKKWAEDIGCDRLQAWIQLNIVDNKINLTPKTQGEVDNYLDYDALRDLGCILSKISKSNPENVPIREWKNIHCLYLNQFFAKVTKGKNGSLSVIQKQKSSITHLPEITLITKNDFISLIPIAKKFSQERVEEDDETADEPDYEERKKVVDETRKSLRDVVNFMKQKKAQEKAAAAAAPPPLVDSSKCIKCGTDLPEGSDKCVMCPKINQKPRKRETMKIANMFLNDHVLCPVYNEVTKKPWCNMITSDGVVIDPNQLTKEGVQMVVDFFAKHNSKYNPATEYEFNAWIPFEYSFAKTSIWTDLKIGMNAWARVEGYAMQCDYILNHAYSVFCSRNEYSFIQLMNFLAHAAQRPWENCNIMLNIQGPQGIGKSAVSKKMRFYTYLFGRP